MKTLTVLGSTGSIGQNTLDIVRKNREKLQIKYLSVNSRVDDLQKQIDEFHPEAVIVVDERAFEKAKSTIKNTRLLLGRQALIDIAGESVDLLINALVGASGVEPTMNAINNNKQITI